MRTWLKHNAPVIGAVAGVIVALVAVLQVTVVGPMNRRFEDVNKRFDDLRADISQRFDQQDKYMNSRFDAVDQRFDRLADDVSELRILVTSIGERVSRNEGHIQIIREQLQTVDAPVP